MNSKGVGSIIKFIRSGQRERAVWFIIADLVEREPLLLDRPAIDRLHAEVRAIARTHFRLPLTRRTVRAQLAVVEALGASLKDDAPVTPKLDRIRQARVQLRKRLSWTSKALGIWVLTGWLVMRGVERYFVPGWPHGAQLAAEVAVLVALLLPLLFYWAHVEMRLAAYTRGTDAYDLRSGAYDHHDMQWQPD